MRPSGFRIAEPPFRQESEHYCDLVSRIEGLTYIEQASLMWHGPEASKRFVAMMMVCFGDESDDTHNRRAYVVSGLLASLPEWVELERRWREALTRENLPEFHAAACEDRLKPFEHHERWQRERLQRIFYGILAALEIWGYAAAIELPAYMAVRDVFDRARPDYSSPYFLAFQFALELTANALDSGGADRSEIIHYVFDQQRQFQGRAKALYDSVLQNPGHLTWTHRLGGLDFDSRLCRTQLQAADVFAYESRKWVSDVKLNNLPDARWQWRLLRDTKRMGVWGLTQESLNRLIEMEQWT